MGPSGRIEDHLEDSATLPTAPPPGPHPSRPRVEPTWGPASSGASQHGVSARASEPSAAPGSGCSTSAMGGADAPRKKPASCAGRGPLGTAPPACPRVPAP